jgi:hypothetical protein
MEARESIPPRELYRWQSLDGNDAAPKRRRHCDERLRLLLQLSLLHQRGDDRRVEDDRDHDDHGADDDSGEGEVVSDPDLA